MFKNILKVIVLTIVIFAFTGCGEEAITTNSVSAGMKGYETANFYIHYPQDWKIIEKINFPSTISKDVIVAFKNNIKNEVFTANINIAVNVSNESISSKDFAVNTIEKNKTNLIGLTNIEGSEETVMLGDTKIKAYVYQFTAKKTASAPTIKFIQLFVSKGDVIYTVTSSHLPNEDESIVKQLNEMLNSFVLK